jgi:membrane associated rhomboid family serine protease
MVFCSDLEENLNQRSSNGSWQFFGIFIISQLVANVIYTIRYRNKFEYSSAGCSASVMGCLFAFMIADPHGTAVNFSFIGGIKNIYTGFIYMILLIYYKWRRENAMVNHEIHLYGAIGGILGVFLVGP